MCVFPCFDVGFFAEQEVDIVDAVEQAALLVGIDVEELLFAGGIVGDSLSFKVDSHFSLRIGTDGAEKRCKESVGYHHRQHTVVERVVLENVGNLVCPAEFDTGASKNAMILSVPEGDDKPLKYPLMFSICDVVLINKIDTKSVFDFDDDAVVERIKKLNPNCEIY